MGSSKKKESKQKGKVVPGKNAAEDDTEKSESNGMRLVAGRLFMDVQYPPPD